MLARRLSFAGLLAQRCFATSPCEPNTHLSACAWAARRLTRPITNDPLGRTLDSVLEVVVGAVAGLLAVIGVVVMLGPALPRSFGFARRRPQAQPSRRRYRAAPTELHPTTVRALSVTARLMGMLKEHGMDRHAAALRLAGRRLQVDEPNGIHAMRQVLRHLRGVRLDDDSDQRIFQGLVGQLQKALDERAQQLELLPN